MWAFTNDRPECLEAARPSSSGSRSFKKFGPVNECIDQGVRTFSFRARQPAFVAVSAARKLAGIQEKLRSSNSRRSTDSADDDPPKNAPLSEPSIAYPLPKFDSL
jgi:hypothetical protein